MGIDEKYAEAVLSTERLILRKFQNGDKSDCFEFLRDKQTCYDDGGYEPFAQMNKQYYELMDKFANQPMRKMIVLKSTGKVIGTVNIMQADGADGTYEIGYVLNPYYRRKGYAYEGVSAVCRFLLDDLHIEAIIAGAIEINEPSLKLLSKLNFRYDGTKAKSFRHPEYGLLDLLYFVKKR